MDQKPESRDERLARIFADPKTLDIICSNMASGTMMVDLAKMWNVPFGELSNWVHKDEARHKRYIAAINDRSQWETDVLIRELQRLAFSDIRLIFKEDGALRAPHEWPDDIAACVASVETNELFEGYGKERSQIGFTRKVKFWNKEKGIELYMRHLGMLVDKIQHSGQITLEDILERANKKSEG